MLVTSLQGVWNLCLAIKGVVDTCVLFPSLKVGQEIEVRPGIVSKDHEGKLMCKPIFSKIVSLFAEHNDLQYAVPGGLIGMCFTNFSSLKAPCTYKHSISRFFGH